MLRKRKKHGTASRREQGLQLVEAAIVMPIMLVLISSIAEFGRYFNMRSTMLRATMTGAVYMSDKPGTNTELLAARRMALCGLTTSCTTTQLIFPGLSDTNFTATLSAVNLINGRYVTVATSNVRFTPLFRLYGRMMNPLINVQTTLRYTGS